MGTVQIDRYKDMDAYFGINHNRLNNDVADAEHVSNKINEMSRQEISNTINDYQLLPVYYYLNVLRDTKAKIKLSPFAKYIDIYLVELTGGNRQQLNTLAYEIVGSTYPLGSSKAMRHAIITNLLSAYR